MRAICYVSTATRRLGDSELQHLLVAARLRNRAHDVTSLLLCGEDRFMQYLEGPKAEVAAIWDVIRADAKHHRIVTLFDRTVPERLFADWSLAWRRVEAAELDRLLQGDWVTTAEGTPQQCWFTSGVRLLRDFWRDSPSTPEGLPGATAPPAAGPTAWR